MFRNAKAPVRVINRRLGVVVRRVLERLEIKNGEAPIFLLGGVKMRRLQARFSSHKGKKPKKAVDILAFPEPQGFPHPEKGPKFLGEIYINREIAKRDPARASFLAVHGLLHLLGYSHGKKGATLKMQRMEKKLMKILNSNI